MVKRVNREQVEAGLDKLGEIDPDSANMLRAFSDYRALIKENPLEMRDACLMIAERFKTGVTKAQELAMYFERLGRGE